MTTISSSNRVIKRSGAPVASTIEPYLPPVEMTASSRRRAPEKAVFPRLTKEGLPLEGSLNQGLLEDQDPFQQEAEREAQALENAVDEAEEILQAARLEAQREAKEILNDVHRRAQKEFEAAREAGYRAGYEAGFQEGRNRASGECHMEFEKRLAEFQQDMEQAIQSVETAKERCLRNYLDELKECAIAIGEKVIQISLRSSGEVIKQMIIGATEKLKKTAWVKIYIDKCDYDMMMEADADIVDELSHLSDNIKFIVMDKEDNGNCIIEMPEEIVDVSVNAQMENIRDILGNVRV